MINVGNPAVVKEDIYHLTNDFSILKYYLGVSRIPTLISSPFRVDKNPSLGLYSYRDNRVYYVDFATGERGDTFTLFSKLWGLNYSSTLSRIYCDVYKIGHIDVNLPSSSESVFSGRSIYPKGTELQATVRDWKKHDIDYWEMYGISLAWAKFGKIFPVRYIFLYSRNTSKSFPAEKYSYLFVENKDNHPTVKLYQPYSVFKWLNNHDSSVWDLWQQLPNNGENLIITSSRKDALCIWENTGIPSCSLQSETQLPKKHIVQQLKERFKKVFVLYDNDFTKEDNPGRRYGKIIADTYNLIQIEIPEELNSKDSSDLCKNKGRLAVKETILNLI